MKHWLKGEGSLNWAVFTQLSDERVHVLALIGYTQYLDKNLPIEEARQEYKKLLESGWIARKPLPSEMDERSLRIHIYD